MFKLRKLLLLTLVVSLISCDENEDPQAGGIVDSKLLVGDWVLASLDATTASTITVNSISVKTTTISKGKNMNYELNMTDSAYTAVGSYDLSTSVSVSGVPAQTTEHSFTDIDAKGAYAINGNAITLKGGLVSFEASAGTVSSPDLNQVATFLINAAGQLVFTQVQSVDTVIVDIPTKIEINSSTVWNKK